MKKYVYRFVYWLLGVIAAIGVGLAISVSLLKYSARHGNARAQATLAYMYFFGTGVEKNTSRSLGCAALAAGSAIKTTTQGVVNKSANVVKKAGGGVLKALKALLHWPKIKDTTSPTLPSPDALLLSK